MKLLRGHRHAAPERRGAALLLAFLVMIVLIAIVYQIHTVTQTDARVSRNEITRAQMDEAIRSVLVQIYEDLAEDARAALAAEGGDAASGPAETSPGGGGGAGTEGPPRNPDTVDSQMDSWYAPQSTNFGDIQIRIFVRDENSKYNILNMLHPDPEQAELAYNRVVRIIDKARGGTEQDISAPEAQEIAEEMRRYMMERRSFSDLPRPRQLTANEEDDDFELPASLAEFKMLESLRETHFLDSFGEDDERIHGLDAFLTIYTSPAMGPEEGGAGAPTGAGGDKVNVNTAPLAVLSALFDQEIDYRLWDEVLAYRNEEEEPLEGEEDEGSLDDEPLLDEFGEELIQKQIFDSLDELEELRTFADLGETEKTDVRALLDVNSDVFEIVLAARISSSTSAEEEEEFTSRKEQEKHFRSGKHLVRVVRSVVWRREAGDDVEIVPLVPFEVVTNPPLQVLDFPDEE